MNKIDKLNKQFLIKSFVRAIYRVIDVIVAPFIAPVILFQLILRKNKFRSFPILKRIFVCIGVYPIRNHYYEPLFDSRKLRKSLREDRNLPGINLNIDEQVKLLNQFNYNSELINIPYYKKDKKIENEYCYTVGPFRSGDAEYLYNMIRHFKPKRIIEIGSGHSTLMARKAIEMNKKIITSYECDHICIEPYENKWLNNIAVSVERIQVEELNVSYFEKLSENDILFIDSSHIIRPQGDVLYEYLEILPTLKKGVIIHIHDIFTPKDYLDEWVKDHNFFWNEQYLLEAFLSNNNDFRIIGATNFLMHNFTKEFSAKCPILEKENLDGLNREPGSFWIAKSK